LSAFDECVIQCVSLGLEGKVSLPLHDPKSNFPLDMAPDSVDDSYKGCEDTMRGKVHDYYLPKERGENKDFNQAWTASFNAATRTQKESYKTAFKYHSLHFFLANALRILNTFWRRFIKQHFHTYRGTNFTSSSLDKKIAKGFETKSCFEIATYFGAPLGKYSQLPHEKEVLFPPSRCSKSPRVLRKERTSLVINTLFVRLLKFPLPVNWHLLSCALQLLLKPIKKSIQQYDISCPIYPPPVRVWV
uniref:NAD(P)(+)--arginine ADP-ribosyltransferase n=1 Tax=Oncorhynchus tshawytscha TaxID=74940 RepID=A0AAZ3QGK6_ONCTS